MKNIKKFVTDNREMILLTTGVLTACAAIVAIASHDAKVVADNAQRLSDFVTQENKLGKSVYQLIDGSYISVAH